MAAQTFYAVYENSTGDLIKCGWSTYVGQNVSNYDPATMTQRTDCPQPPLCKGMTNLSSNMHRWNGSAWIEVAQP